MSVMKLAELGLDLSLPVLLVLSLVVVTVACWAYKPLFSAFLLIPFRVGQGEVHRLLTAGWVHADLGHLFFNGLTLYLFAGRVVTALGEARFLLLYFTSVVVAFVPTTLRFLRSRQYSSLGASGAVAAVMFSGILLFPQQELYLFFLPIKVPGYLFALGYLAYSAWHSYSQSDNVNHDAHFYGAAYGVFLTYLLEPRSASQGIDTILKSLS
jgi:membrane associated rhomboid family serine protease